MSRAGSVNSSVVNSALPIEVQRTLRLLEGRINDLSGQVRDAHTQLASKIGNSPQELLSLSGYMRSQLQASGSRPLSINALPGVAAQDQPVATPTVTTIGGVKAYAAPAHQFINGLDTTGTLLSVQPAFADVSGLGSAATHASTDFDTSGSASAAQAAAIAASCQRASNLSDVASAPTSRTNLGLGSAATHASTDFDASGAATAAQAAAIAASCQRASNLSDVASAATARTNLGVRCAWTNYTPTVAASGSMTITALTVYSAKYIQIDNLVFVSFAVQFGTGGTASNIITVTLPVATTASYSSGTANGAAAGFSLFYNSPGNPLQTVLGFPLGASSTMNLYLPGGGNYAVGSGFSYVQGTFLYAV